MRAICVVGALAAGLTIPEAPANAAGEFGFQSYRQSNRREFRQTHRIGGNAALARLRPRRMVYIIDVSRQREELDEQLFGRVYSRGYERGYARDLRRPYARGFGRGELRSEGRSRYTGFGSFGRDDTGGMRMHGN